MWLAVRMGLLGLFFAPNSIKRARFSRAFCALDREINSHSGSPHVTLRLTSLHKTTHRSHIAVHQSSHINTPEVA